MKLSTKILIVTSAMVLIATGYIGYVTLTSIHDTIVQEVKNSQGESTIETIDKIDRTLNEYHKNIRLIAEMAFLQELLTEPNLEHDHKEHGHVQFSKLLNLTGPWDKLVLVDSDDAVVLSTNKSEMGASMPDDAQFDYVVQTARTGRIAYSDAIKESEEAMPKMLFAAPVRATNKVGAPLLGVIVGYVSMPIINEILTEIETPASLYNQNGTLLFKKDSATVTFPPLHTLESMLDQRTQEHKTYSAGIIDETLYTMIVQPGYTEYRGNEWTLVLGSPESVLVDEVKGIVIGISILLGSVMIILLLMLLLLLQFLVVHPIKILKATTQKIAEGDFSKRANISTTDEIGELGSSFNEMAERLQTLYDELDQKVQERTSELEEKVDELERLNQVMVGRELRMVELKKEINELKTQTATGSDTSDKEQQKE